MSDELNAGADTALAEGNDSGDVTSNLEAFFISQESQVDNSSDEADEASEPAADEPAETAEEEAEPEKDDAEAETETAEEPAAEAEAEVEAEEAADFDALTPKSGDFLDAEGLKAKFPRQAKAFYEEAAKYSEAAKKGSEVIEGLGGEAFVPGMTNFAKSLQAGEYRDALGGIAETVGPEGLVFTLAEAARLAFVESDAMAADDNPAKAHFGKTLQAITNSVIEERFGPDMTIAKLSKLALWDQAGWFEAIDKWQEENYVDHDELDKLLEAANDPKLIETKRKVKELETQLAEERTKAQESTAVRQTEVDNSFGKMAADEIGKTLSEVVWARSPLRDLPSDTAETKEEKALLRNQLLEDAKTVFNGDAASRKLLEGYRTGRQTTALFQKEFATAINNAVLGTREKTAIAERLLAKLYGKSRNSQLASKQNRIVQPDSEAGARHQPTVTKTHGNEKLTSEQIEKNLLDGLIALGA